jgi:hypothetical protein
MPGRKQTMLGVKSDMNEIVAAAKANKAAEPAATPAPSAAAGEGNERTTDVGISEPPKGAMGRTMLGMPPLAKKPAAPAEPAPEQRSMARTMLGMPNPTAAAAAAVAKAVAAAAAQPVQAAQSAAALRAEPSLAEAHTLLGIAGPPAPRASEPFAKAEPSSAEEPRAGVSRSSGARAQEPARTMLGLEDDAPAVESPPRGSRISPARGSVPRASRPSGPGSRRGPGTAALALAALALVGAGVLGYMAMRSRGPDVRVRVVADAEGESMLFEVPGALPGAKLRFGGQEKPIEAGRASFPLAPDSLRVGKNAVLYDVVQSTGSVESGRAGLSVDYRVTLDTAPLRAGKPVVDVVVAALPGSKVWLDGEPVTLDAQGRALRADPLALAAASGRAEHVVKYRVQPPAGEASVGEVRASIPVTMMQIDRPGTLVVTDRDRVEIAGAVDKDARVTIDARPVEVLSGRFLYQYELPRVGDYAPEVTAMADGKAPRAVTLKIERVEDLRKAAEGFDPDPSLTYAKIAQNPTIYRGQHVLFEGRVYNVNVEGGKSALQVLVRACPHGERCPLWVSYPAATELTVDSWVRVLGVVQGEQQFRSETEEVKSVPKVEAVFLLPAKP